MSIISAICAEQSNKVKKEWQEELKTAYKERDWEKVRRILKKMEGFYFSE